jgi:hypothetical protein
VSTDAKTSHPTLSPFDGERAADRPGEGKSVERLFPFVLRTRILLIGRDTLARSKGRLHFVLITTDISENSRAQILKDFAHYPVVQHYTESDLEKFFRINGAKVVGFAKSGLAQSIYAELKEHRINQPMTKSKPPELPPHTNAGKV